MKVKKKSEKEITALTFQLSTSVYNEMSAFCKKHGLTKRFFIESAIQLALVKIKNNSSKNDA